MGLRTYFVKDIVRKTTVLSVIVSFLVLIIGCKEEPIIKEVPILVEEELAYDKVEDMSDDRFDNLLSKVRDRVMVFDIEEVHDEIYPTLKKEVNLDLSDEEIEYQVQMIIEPFMDEWTHNVIKDYLTDYLGQVSESDVERFEDKINNKSLIEFIIIYEKNFLKGSR